MHSSGEKTFPVDKEITASGSSLPYNAVRPLKLSTTLKVAWCKLADSDSVAHKKITKFTTHEA